MTIAEILHQLEKVPDRADFAPYATALEAAIEQREAITPELIAAIDRVSADPTLFLDDQHLGLHEFALYLLAQFRETRARDAVLRFFSLPGRQALDLTGDAIAEYGAVLLASVCGGDPEPLFKLILDESVNQFVRHQAIEALAVQALWEERPRDAVIADLRSLFALLPKPGDCYVWAALLVVICDYAATELAPEARHACAENLVDEEVIDAERLENDLFHDDGDCHGDFCERNAPFDAIANISGWVCFTAEEDELPWKNIFIDPLPFGDFPNPPPAGPFYSPDLPPLPPLNEPGIAITTGEQPYLAPPKVGRNDPCPCGSGKKHKKCCGKN